MDSEQKDDDADALEDAVIWTPEVERVAKTVARWVRLDTPGGTVFGKQRNGKSSACTYLAAVLPGTIGYQLAIITWTIPKNDSSKEREFTQERMQQSGCSAILHRDVAVLRGRLYDHIFQLAAAAGARRIVVIIDEAQNLCAEQYGYLVHCFNALVSRQLRPFFLLVGQPELKETTYSWLRSAELQVVGRFHVNRHVFRGIALSDLKAVLSEFDKSSTPDGPSRASILLPDAYARGWRIADLDVPLREAVQLASRQHNLTEEIRIPMQYLRSTVLAFIYYIVEERVDPMQASSAVLLRCLRESGFLYVITHYVENEDVEDPGAFRKGAA